MSFAAEFTLTPQTPILMHSDDVLAADELEAWRKDPANRNISKPGDDRSPPWTWHTYLYSDGTNLTVPSHNLMVAIRQAGVKKIMKKQTTFKEISQSGIQIENEYLTFKNSGVAIKAADIVSHRDKLFPGQMELAKKLGFSLFIKRATIGKAKHVRVRPRFDKWSISGRLFVSVPEITLDILKELFTLAGRVGLCDWRPGCKSPGPYGMFAAEVKKVG